MHARAPRAPSQVYCLDSQFVQEMPKFIAGQLSALSAMVQLELPHINVLTKVDLCGSKVGWRAWRACGAAWRTRGVAQQAQTSPRTRMLVARRSSQESVLEKYRFPDPLDMRHELDQQTGPQFRCVLRGRECTHASWHAAWYLSDALPLRCSVTQAPE